MNNDDDINDKQNQSHFKCSVPENVIEKIQ